MAPKKALSTRITLLALCRGREGQREQALLQLCVLLLRRLQPLPQQHILAQQRRLTPHALAQAGGAIAVRRRRPAAHYQLLLLPLLQQRRRWRRWRCRPLSRLRCAGPQLCNLGCLGRGSSRGSL